MAARVVSVAFEGVEARRVDVEVQRIGGQSAFVVVGLADKAVGEARERVRAAFAGLGLALPAGRVVANLARRIYRRKAIITTSRSPSP